MAPWWNKRLSGLRAKTKRVSNVGKTTGQWDAYKETLTCYNKEIRKPKWSSWICSMLESRYIITALSGETVRRDPQLGDVHRGVCTYLPLLWNFIVDKLLWELSNDDDDDDDDYYYYYYYKLHTLRMRRHRLDALFLTQVYFGFKFCPSARYIRDFALFNVCSPFKNCPSARCASAANVVRKNVDVFGARNVLLSHFV
jgi:hypothetical protein